MGSLGATQSGIDGRNQHITIKRLGQEVHGPGFHGFYGGRNVALPADKDDTEARLIVRDDLLQFQTCHSGHIEIKKQACWALGNAAVQEFRSRRVGFDGVSVRSQQTRDPAQQAGVIVDNVNGSSYGWRGFHSNSLLVRSENAPESYYLPALRCVGRPRFSSRLWIVVKSCDSSNGLMTHGLVPIPRFHSGESVSAWPVMK